MVGGWTPSKNSHVVYVWERLEWIKYTAQVAKIYSINVDGPLVSNENFPCIKCQGLTLAIDKRDLLSVIFDNDFIEVVDSDQRVNKIQKLKVTGNAARGRPPKSRKVAITDLKSLKIPADLCLNWDERGKYMYN